jgi:hypothetical protein
VEGYFAGRLEFRRFFCPRHMRAWEEALRRDERRGILSWAWSYEIRRIATRRTLRRWMKLAHCCTS